ncbi:MAG: ATP-binding protein, partial [Spirochaetaceae bacterium]|nr:ATP-binding protein [Spirochaetaceae bacterium]
IDAAGEVKSLIGGFNEMADHLERNKATMDQYIQEITFLKEYNETVIHSLRAGILIVDRHLVVEKANGFFLESFPQDSGRPEGMNLDDLRAAVLDEEIIQKARDISGGRKETWSKIKREGSVVWDLKLYPLRFAPSDGEGRCVIELDDVSQRTELEQKIIQAEKLTSLGFLSAGIAHEINNPLSTILSNAQHLLSRPRDADDKVCLEWIEQETNRIAGIVKELLDFAHAAEGPSPESDVNACVTEVIRLVRYGLSSETDVDILLTVEPNLPSVKLPADELRQILLNLIQNAIHAVDGRGSIEVETAQIDKDFIIVRVADDGSGIAPELRPRIFDPFFTTKPDGVGTGLGLSIVYGFVKKAGGDISVTDNNGRGTVFSMELPVGGYEK